MHVSWITWLLRSFTALALLLPSAALAQPSGMGVVVTIHTAAGQPLVQVTVAAHDLAGTLLAQATTDVQGHAALRDLPTTTVRIVVAGHLPDGTTLTQSGADAAGSTLLLDGPATPLDLLVATDGTVDIDPASMLISQPSGITMTQSINVREAPAAPLAMQPQLTANGYSLSPTSALTSTSMVSTTSISDAAEADAAATNDSRRSISPLLLLAGMALLLIAALVLLAALRRPRGKRS